MRQYLMGLAAAMAVATVSAPAMAGCGGCSPVVSYNYSSCAQPLAAFPCGGYGYGAGLGYSAGAWGYARLAAPAQYYAVQPQYYYVNQGPTYTGPGMYAPLASYQQRAVAGWNGYGAGYYGYNGGPYANPTNYYYQTMPPAAAPTVYSYRRVYRPGYGVYGPRVYRGPRVYAPNVRYGYRHHVAPRHYATPRYRAMPHHYK